MKHKFKHPHIKHDPRQSDKIHRIGDTPYLVNKADNLIDASGAEDEFTKAFHTMWTWASRMLMLAAASPERWENEPDDYGPRDWHLEHFDMRLENVEVWCRQMREELDRELGVQGLRKRLEKVKALEERAGTEGEREAARHQRQRLEARLEGGTSLMREGVQ